jgi:hypothetical protein
MVALINISTNNVQEFLFLLGMMVHAYNLSNAGGGGRNFETSRPAWETSESLSQKQNINKRARDMAYVVEH